MAAGIRSALGFASWIFLAGAIVLMFLVILGGVTNSSALRHTYFLSADTSGIPGARAISQWTYFYVCGSDNADCGTATAGLPLGYAWVGTSQENVPAGLNGSYGNGTTSRYYFYMWRFGWVFMLIALAFAALALLTALVSFTRIGAGLSSLIVMTAAFFQLLAAVLMTVTFVKARDAFRDQGRNADVGSYAFGFTWASFVALFLAGLLWAGGCLTGSRDRKQQRQSTATTGTTGTTTVVADADNGIREDKQTSFFRRNRSTRSRGSFIDNESQRRVVKEEY